MAVPGSRGEVHARGADRRQAAVARRSAESRATIPDLELELEADAGILAEWVDSEPLRVTASLVRACAGALREHPLANGAYRDGGFERYERVNIGVVLAAERQYAIPTVFDADRLGLDELTERLERLERSAREGTLRAPQLSGATFTLWDLGPLGVQRGVPLVVPGQAAALGAGRVRERVLVRGGRLHTSHVLTLTLVSDHRILYGAAAAGFLVAIRLRLEQEANG